MARLELAEFKHEHQKDDEMSIANEKDHENEHGDEDEDDDEKAMRETMLMPDVPRVHPSIRCKNEVLAKQVKDQVALMRYMRSKQGASATKAYHKDMAAHAERMHKARTMQAKENYERGGIAEVIESMHPKFLIS